MTEKKDKKSKEIIGPGNDGDCPNILSGGEVCGGITYEPLHFGDECNDRFCLKCNSSYKHEPVAYE